MTSESEAPAFLHCNECLRETRHRVVHSAHFDNTETIEANWTVHSHLTYSICECGGCGTVLVVREHVGDDTNGETLIEYLPPREYRRRPAWLRKFRWKALAGKDPKSPLLNEIYSALSTDSLRLAALGLRALLEHVMVEQNHSDAGSFSNNVEAFMKAGHISANQRSALVKILDFGSAVMHRGHAPTREQVIAALDMTESIMQSIYSDITEVQRSMSDLPPRPPRSK